MKQEDPDYNFPTAIVPGEERSIFSPVARRLARGWCSKGEGAAMDGIWPPGKTLISPPFPEG
jgi:hypothetical protein